MTKNYKLAEYKEACKEIDTYMSGKSNYYFIHYACQNFHDDVVEKGERITTIGVLNCATLSVKLFSFASKAKELKINLTTANNTQLNEIEKQMLNDYFDFVKGHKDIKWIHWRMNTNCYGFEAVERRYKTLGGNSYTIPENNKINMSFLFKKKYGENYATIQNINYGKMYMLFDLNKLSESKILSGLQEAVALTKGNYEMVDFSVSEKLNAFYQLMDLSANNKLKTKSSKIKDVYGIGINSFFQYIQDNAVLAFIASILGGIIATIICKILII